DPGLMYEPLLFPEIPHEHWQMMPWERIGMTGVLARLKPKGALEIGTYHGGSLSLIAQFAESVISIDIDPAVAERFALPPNAALWIGDSATLIPQALAHFEAQGIPLNFILLDADHHSAAVQRDLELILCYRPREPLIVLMHDSGNAECRRGIL